MRKLFTTSLAIVILALVSTIRLSAQDLTIAQPTAISGWTSTQGAISVAPGGSTLPTVSSGTATCLSGYTLRLGSNASYLQITSSAGNIISRLAFDGTANSSGTYAYICAIAYSTDGGSTWCSESNALTFTINGYNNACLNYDNSALPANINAIRIWRKYVNGGSGVGSGQTLRMGNLKVWASSTCTAASVFNVGGTTSILSGNSTNITLDGSTVGINYQLYKGGVAEGAAIAGTGNSLSWNVSPGSTSTYTIKSVGTASTCETAMTGSAVITVTSSSPVVILTSALGTNTQTVTYNNPITTITYSIADGTASTASVTWTGTADANTAPSGVSVSFVYPTLTISGTPGITGNYGYTVTTDGTPAATATGTITVSKYQTGDYKSVASGNWGTTTTWNKWSGSAWVTSTDFPNATTTDVYIEGGFTVNNETSARSIRNLYLSGSSVLTSSNKVNSPVYLKVYGTTVSVETASRIGNLLTGNDADGISFDVFSTALTLTGGGTYNMSRIRTNTASTTVTIDNDVTINYHGSTNGGNAAGYYAVAGDNNTLTVNAGKTLTFGPWSCITPVATSHTQGTTNMTYNINGTLTFVDGLVSGNATANGWSGHTNGYFSLAVTGKTVALNIGSTGIVNVSELYPNGTKSDNTTGGGDVVTINVASGGVLNVSKILDLRTTGQTISGTGTVNIADGAVLKKSVTTTVAAAADNTKIATTLNEPGTVNYDLTFNGASAQTTEGLASSVYNLTINNASGVSLYATQTINGTLNLTSGKLSLGANDLSIGTAISGGSASSYIVTDGSGKVSVPAASAVATLIPVGASVTSYDPVSVTPATATTFAVKAYATLSGTPAYGVRYNAKEWDITPATASSTLIALTPSNLVESVTNPVIGHFVTDSYVNATAVMTNAGTTFTATFDTFSPFVTGANIDVTGMKEGENNILRAYPNHNQLMVCGTKAGDMLTVYSMNGQIVTKVMASGNLSGLNLDKGLYLLTVKSGNNTENLRVVMK